MFSSRLRLAIGGDGGDALGCPQGPWRKKVILSKLEQVLVLASRGGYDLDYEPGEKRELDTLTVRSGGSIRFKVKGADLWSQALSKLEDG